MSLQDILDAAKAKVGEKAPAEVLQLFADATKRLEDTGIEAGTLNVGDKMPDFKLPNATGQDVKLGDLLKDGPVVINFYRGGWCPYCNLELKAYADALPEIKALGATLVGISPETPDTSLSTKEKHSLEFEVLSDSGNHVAKNIGLVFPLAEELRGLYMKFGFDLPSRNGDDSWEMPMPATYVVDTDGTIKLAFAKADYTQRAEPKDVIDALK